MVGIYNVVSLTPQGAAGDGISLLPGVSSDGNWLAYYTSSSNIGGSYPGGYYDLVVARLVK
jgi:hypothetical protein